MLEAEQNRADVQQNRANLLDDKNREAKLNVQFLSHRAKIEAKKSDMMRRMVQRNINSIPESQKETKLYDTSDSNSSGRG